MDDRTRKYIDKKTRIMIDSYHYFDNPNKYDVKPKGRPKKVRAEKVEVSE